MGFLEDLFGGGVTSEDLWMPAVGDAVSNYSQVAELFDRAGTIGYDLLGNGFPNFSTESSYPDATQFVAAPLEPGRSLGYSIAGSIDAAPEGWGQSSSPWDTFNDGLQKVGDFTSSKGGQFLMGGLGGLAAYLDAKKKNALMKQMMEQAAAEKAARAASAAAYSSPARVTNTKMVMPSWGVGTQAFTGNSLRAMTPRSTSTMYAAEGGFISGGSPGQADKVPAMLSDGEFVFDADTVSALGDGNNAAGASALEQMRQNIRKHKRSAPPDKIPPKAKRPEVYLRKGTR